MSNSSEVEFEIPLAKTTLREAMHLLQRKLILHALAQSNGNKSKAAKLLGMNRTTMVMMLKRVDQNKITQH